MQKMYFSQSVLNFQYKVDVDHSLLNLFIVFQE